jgi:hypothetical protein
MLAAVNPQETPGPNGREGDKEEQQSGNTVVGDLDPTPEILPDSNSFGRFGPNGSRDHFYAT